MKKEFKTKDVSWALSIVGMVLLLLFSPCKIRNFVEVELGVPQTDVLNKSQAVDTQSDCQTFEVAKAVNTNSKPAVQQPSFSVTEASDCEFKTNLFSQLFTPFAPVKQQVTDIPLYILYQNLKIYA